MDQLGITAVFPSELIYLKYTVENRTPVKLGGDLSPRNAAGPKRSRNSPNAHYEIGGLTQ